MDKLFFPLNSLQETFSVLYLISKLDYHSEFDSITASFNQIFNTNFKENKLKMSIDKYLNIMSMNLYTFHKLTKQIDELISTKKKYIFVKLHFPIVSGVQVFLKLKTS